jgi:hypothetical protein
MCRLAKLSNVVLLFPRSEVFFRLMEPGIAAADALLV